MKYGNYILPILIGAIILFILAVFEPFELGLFAVAYTRKRYIGYALMAIVIVYVSESYGRRYLEERHHLSRLRIPHNLIHGSFTLVVAGIFNAAYTEYMFGFDPITPGFWRIMWYTFIIGFIPTLLVWAWNYVSYLEARKIDADTSNNSETDVLGNRSLVIPVSGDIEDISIPVSQIILATTSGNYIYLYYLSGSEVKQCFIRKTLSSLAEELPEDNFIRCHRSHLVNMDYVLSQEGSTKGLKLKINHIKEMIQVSRGYSVEVRVYIRMYPK